jgi:hypothetical protein
MRVLYHKSTFHALDLFLVRIIRGCGRWHLIRGWHLKEKPLHTNEWVNRGWKKGKAWVHPNEPLPVRWQAPPKHLRRKKWFIQQPWYFLLLRIPQRILRKPPTSTTKRPGVPGVASPRVKWIAYIYPSVIHLVKTTLENYDQNEL